MNKNPTAFALSWITVFFTLVLICLVPQAQNTLTNAYDGLDIVFLVDQSGSMGGAAFGYPQGQQGNDPLSLRFEAVQYALDTLGQYRLTLAEDIPIRIAVVNFGDASDQGDIARGWVDIAPIAEQSAWDVARASLQNIFSTDSFRARVPQGNLGNTNFANAFSAAQELFGILPASSQQTHLRAVILLTDGAPCVPAEFDCSSAVEQQRYFDLLEQQVAGAFAGTQYRLYALVLDQEGSLWQRWQNRWQTLSGAPERAIRVGSSQQVGVGFLNILIELMATVRGGTRQDVLSLQTGENNIVLPPYLHEVRVSVFKSATSPGVLNVTRPDRTTMSETDPTLTIENRDRPIEVWTIRNPQPGNWVFRVGDTNDRIDVYLDLIPIEVVAAIRGDVFIEGDDVEIDLSLTAGNGMPLQDYGEVYTPRANLTLTRPDGSQSIIPLTKTSSGNYTTSIRSAEAGVYNLGLDVTTQTPENRVYTIFSRTDFDSFQVRQVLFELVQPQTADFLVGEQLVLEALLTDDAGRPLVFPQIDVQAAMGAAAGLETHPLFPASADGFYRTEIPLNAAGSFDLTISAQVTHADGRTFGLGTPFTRRITVQQSQFIALTRIEPDSPVSDEETRLGFPSFEPNPLIITVEIRTDDAQPVTLEEISVTGEAGWTLRVEQDGQPVPDDSFTISPSSPGRYIFSMEEAGTGEFSISIGLTGELSGVYVYDRTNASLDYTINRRINPLFIITIGIIGLVILFAAAAAVALILRRKRRRRHPARGTLVIRPEGENSGDYWNKPLDGLHRNYLVLSNGHLRKIGIKRLVVTCTDSKMSQAKRIKVTAYGMKETLFKDRLLTPGGPPVRLAKSKGGLLNFGEERETGQPVYLLYKDPENTSFSLDS